MNERIKELLTKSTYEILGVNQVDQKQFAELIVKECLTTIIKESKWYWDKDEFESANAIQNAARRVKEHFGVE